MLEGDFKYYHLEVAGKLVELARLLIKVRLLFGKLLTPPPQKVIKNYIAALPFTNLAVLFVDGITQIVRI